MTFMSWLHAKLAAPHRHDIFAEAMNAVEEVTIKVRSLREQIQPYVKANDPFAAMTRARISAMAYRREHP